MSTSPLLSGGSGKEPHQLRDLSVVGREIVASGAPKQKGAPSSVSSHGKQMPGDGQSAHGSNSDDTTKPPKSATSHSTQQRHLSKGGYPVDPTNDLVFGFLEEDLVEGLNENNQWKDRTNAMEAIETLFE